MGFGRILRHVSNICIRIIIIYYLFDRIINEEFDSSEWEGGQADPMSKFQSKLLLVNI